MTNVSDLLRMSVMEVKQVMEGRPTIVPNAPPRKRLALVRESSGS